MTRPVRCSRGESVERNFQCTRRGRDAREHQRGRRVQKLRILDEHRSIELLDEFSESRGIAVRDENEKRASLCKAAREFFPPLTPHDLSVDQRISPARHHEEIWNALHIVADLVERDSIEKAVRYAVRIFFPYQRAQRGKITDEIAYD